MSSSFQGKPDSEPDPASNKEAVVFPEGARPTDDSPTVISKTNPIVNPVSSHQDKIIDLARKATSPEAIAESLRGRRLAHYELIEPIGVGGMAAVIRARDTQLDRMVALKILPPEMALERENVQRFHQEGKAAARLDHDNIARVFNCGEDQGLHFIAFEHVEGMNLRTVLEKRGRLPVAEAVRIVMQIATGLEHATTRGVVHRDVKPSNIIITPAGQAKLVDMGLARNMERRRERDLTQSGMTLGTFDYISPEQALDPREADARSDIYSLGCTLYHMLTGQPPVPDGTPAKKLQHHQHHAPVDPRQIDPTIPAEIVTILGKMMAKDPRDRYQRPIHLVHHLMQFGQKLGITEGLPEVILYSDAGLRHEPRNRPILLIGLALVTLVVVVTLVSLGTDPGPLVPTQLPVKGNGFSGPVADPRKKKDDPVPAATPEFIENRQDLRAMLSDPARVVTAKLNAEVTIPLEGHAIKANKDQRFELESDEAGSNKLGFTYQGGATPFGLTIDDGEEIIFRRIRFEIDADGNPNQAVAIVAVRGGRKIRFEQCIFAQPKVQQISATKRVPLASVLIDTPEDAENPPVVSFDQCYFESNKEAGGQVAVAINGAAIVIVTNCAFRPHGAFFSFRDKCTIEHTFLDVRNCVGFVETGPAFRFGKSGTRSSSARLRVERSAFLRPGLGLSDVTGQPGLIFLETGARVQFEGQRNLYYHLNALVERKGEADLIAKEDAFKNFLVKNQGSDDQSILIDPADTTNNPLAHGTPLASADHEVLAFGLKAPYHENIGLQKTWFGKAMPRPAPEIAKAFKKFVGPDSDAGKTGYYKNLRAAIAAAENDDVIYIKHGDSRDVKAAVELRPGISVTLKPFDETHKPRLIFDTDYASQDSALFTIKRGRGILTIEQMEILLAPDLADYKTQSMFQLGESAHLVFKKCVLTMKPTSGVKCNVVTFVDLEAMMKMGAASGTSARVEFRECFVRGAGDLISLRGSRVLPVEMDDCLVALDGSLLDIKANDKAMPMEVGVRWKMKRSSIFTTKSIFALHSMAEKGLMETSANFESCLLASLVHDMPAILFDMSPDRPEDVDKCFKWQGKQNYFANFDVLKVREWKTSDPDMKSESGTLTFPNLDKTMQQKLWDATPDWFKVAEAEQKSILGFGIREEVEKRLLPAPEPDE